MQILYFTRFSLAVWRGCIFGKVGAGGGRLCWNCLQGECKQVATDFTQSGGYVALLGVEE